MPLVLVIDDSILTRSVIRRILRENDYDVVEAANGRIGLELINEYRPDFILMDIIMPEMDGLDVLRELQTMKLDTPVAIVTADIQESTHRQCMELGAIAVFNKPPNEKILLNALSTFFNSDGD